MRKQNAVGEPSVDRRTHMLDAAVRVIARKGVRGLRVAELAAEAGVSTALIYYHFTDREGIVSAALHHVNDRARTYTTPTEAGTDPRRKLEAMLLAELQDSDEVRINSLAWGELRASAAFSPALHESLRTATAEWNRDVEELIQQIPDCSADDSAGPADRLTALVEGLSARWHSGSITLDQARRLLLGAIEIECARKSPHPKAGAVVQN